MKSYEEMAARVLERRDRYFARRRAARKKLSAGLACAACAAVVFFAKTGMFSTMERDHVDFPAFPDMQQKMREPLGPAKEYHEQMVRWKSAEEVIAETEGVMGVCVPGFVAYNGGFYAGAGFDQSAEQPGRFVPNGDEVWFGEEYRFSAYAVENEPDCVAIAVNGGIQIYKKVFDVTFELDSKIYGIRYDAVPDRDVTVGEAVLEGDGFTVHKTGEKELHLVNILPLLMEHWPVLFEGGENYDVAWMAAFPLGEAVEDIPVVENPGSTGALIPFEEVWGGSYTDRAGNMVIWLTENTPENQREVFGRNPALRADSTIFKDADYSLAYLTQLMADISKLMGDGELPHVPTAALREDINRVEVSLTCEDESCMERVLACDTLGGAVEFRFSEGGAVHDVMIMKESQK